MKLTGIYTLNDQNQVIPCDNIFDQAMVWDDPERRTVGKTELNAHGSNVLVSTVFISVDPGSMHHGPEYQPRVFETALFLDGKIESPVIVGRWSTWQEAEQEHKNAVAKVKRSEFKLIQE